MKCVFALALLMPIASAAAAQTCGKIVLQGTVEAQERAERLIYARVEAYRALRKSAIAVQAEDGGKLDPVHEAVFQARLDDLNRGFSRDLCNLKRLDANGRIVESRPD